jgi:hypothetical protein
MPISGFNSVGRLPVFHLRDQLAEGAQDLGAPSHREEAVGDERERAIVVREQLLEFGVILPPQRMHVRHRTKGTPS